MHDAWSVNMWYSFLPDAQWTMMRNAQYAGLNQSAQEN